MKKRLMAFGIAGAAFLAPAGALAGHGTGCDYTASQEHSTTVGSVVIYADTDGGGGTSGTADQAAGVCAGPGSFEAGHSATLGSDRSAWYGLGIHNGLYLIADGDNLENPDPVDGYIGISNYETGSTSCRNNTDCSGSNGGGEVGPGGGPYAPVYVPLACGNTTGPSWDDSRRDGCEIP
ncbi:MAG TPA: hypothetical protein VM841_11305 [Actinomycetota bacterium]|nr:hypothetical protein [Actinomycetota bacterium]